MSEAKQGTPQPADGPAPSDVDRKKALAWFKQGTETREKRSYDYAIECYITGLGFWPEAVQDGHMPLYSLAIQRMQAGGKKPGMLDGLKLSMSGKDAKQAMLNAETLMAKDPTNHTYLEGVLKNAVRGGFLATARWVAPLVYDALKREKKPNTGRFRTYRELLTEAGAAADHDGHAAEAAWFFGEAVNSIDFLAARGLVDDRLRDEQRDLSGRHTIARGKYSESETFRDSIRDADSQKHLHDAERLKQGEQTMAEIIAVARRAYEAEPTVPAKINALVELLLRRDEPEEEQQAIAVLLKAAEDTGNYSFKVRADDVRLKQLQRQARRAAEVARATGADDDRQVARQAIAEQLRAELDIFRERVANYPTDLRMKFRLGRALFSARQYHEAIPQLQAAQADPRTRDHVALLIGRCFLETNAPAQAREVLREALDRREGLEDDLSRDLLYWLARSYEATDEKDLAKQTYGRLLRIDYNYGNGEARQRHDALN
jgi:hypothetical protein